MLKTPVRLFNIAVFVAATAFSNTPPTLAAGPGTCQDYVKHALAAAKTVRENRCGYDLNHPQWSEDPNVHARWCRESTEESVKEERISRGRREGKCSACRWYAQKAIRALTIAVNNECSGLDGPRWSPDEEGHFGWCMSVRNFSDFYDEQEERDKLVGDCLVTKTRQPLVSEPARPELTIPPIGAQQSTALQRSGPRVSDSVDTTQKRIVKKKRPKASRLQVAGRCKLPDGRPCPPSTKVFSPGLLEGGGSLGTQGPAATGTPLQTSSPQVQRGGGGVPGLR
jgi:hypothetical protein